MRFIRTFDRFIKLKRIAEQSDCIFNSNELDIATILRPLHLEVIKMNDAEEEQKSNF